LEWRNLTRNSGDEQQEGCGRHPILFVAGIWVQNGLLTSGLFEPCINKCPIAPLRCRVGAPAFKPGIKVEMTLGFSPGVWELEHLFVMQPPCILLKGPGQVMLFHGS